jgi:hypothetical protein
LIFRILRKKGHTPPHLVPRVLPSRAQGESQKEK